VSECDREASTMRRPRPGGAVEPLEEGDPERQDLPRSALVNKLYRNAVPNDEVTKVSQKGVNGPFDSLNHSNYCTYHQLCH
jgi:hypothetical protein